MLKNRSLLRPIVSGIVAAALVCGLVNDHASAAPTPAAPSAPAKTIYTEEEQKALSQARTSKQSVPVASTTTETSQVVANPDGTFTLASSREAIRTKTGLGAWVPIDTRLARSSDGRIRPAATALDVSLSGGGTGSAISLHRNQTNADLSLPFTLPTPTLDGSTATYSDVLPGVDLQLTAYPEHVTEVLVVKTAAAAHQPQLAALKLNIDTTGGSLSVAADGSSTITDTTGTTLFQAAPPTMWDSRPNRDGTPTARTSSDNTTKIPVTAATATTRRTTTATDTKTLTLTPATNSLTGADVVYPLYIDPSFGIGRSNFLVVRSSGQNYWTNTDVLRVGYCAWSGCSPYSVARSFFDFNITSVVSGHGGLAAHINSATVTVTQVSAASSAATPVNLSRARAINSGLGWGGPLDAGIQGLNTSSGSGTVLRFDNYAVRDYAQEVVTSGSPTITFALNSPNEADAYQWKKFNNNPNLTYTYPPATPTNLSAGAANCNGVMWVNKRDVTLSATVSDNGNGSGVYQDFDVYNVATGFYTASWTFVPSGAGTATLGFTLPDGTYYFITRSSARPADSMWVYSPDVRSANFTVSTTTGVPSAPSVFSPDFPQKDGTTGDPYGMTRLEAFTQPATFTITATDPGTIAYAYSWDNDIPPDIGTCPDTALPTSTKPAFVRTSNGTATIPYPAHYNSIATLLIVRAITPSLNVSAPMVYEIDPWHGSTTRVEAATGQFTTTMTKSIDTAHPAQLSSGNQVQLTTTAANQTAIHTVTMPTAGHYQLAIEFSTTPNSGDISLTAAAGTCTADAETSETLTINLNSALPGKKSVVYANEDPDSGTGWTCQAGGTIAYQITGPATIGSVIDIDYVRGLNDAWPSTLASGSTLQAGEQLEAFSSSGVHYILSLGTNCNLTLTQDDIPTWSTNTADGDNQCRLTMQADGNLILFTSTGTTAWASNTAAFPGASLTLPTDGDLKITRSGSGYTLWSTTSGYIANRLYAGQHLSANDTLYTADHTYRIVMQADCNLVIYQTGTPIWYTGTQGQGTGCHADMQADGNFVLYNSAGTALWHTHTNGQSIAYLTLQPTGKAALINTNGTTTWTT